MGNEVVLQSAKHLYHDIFSVDNGDVIAFQQITQKLIYVIMLKPWYLTLGFDHMYLHLLTFLHFKAMK